MGIIFHTHMGIKVYAIQLSYEITNEEKSQAERALQCFKYAKKLLKVAKEHLDIMKTPFTNHPDIDNEQVLKFRAALRRFRDKSVDNFNAFKVAAFKCISSMQMFSSDTQTIKVIKSFISSVEDLEKEVNQFVELFSDLKSKTFVKDVVSSITEIQKECEDIDDIIEERIIFHLQSNILGKNWTDSISKELQLKIEKQTPLMMDIYNQRQKQLNMDEK